MQPSPLPPAFANTVAAIEAELDHPYAAWTYLQQTLSSRADGRPSDDDWYVIGRIAESYGLRDDAIAIYKRIAKPKHPSKTTVTGYDFAQRRLRMLLKH
jgi:hypothetical protein